MRPRHGIVEIFSNFLQFDADRFSHWIADPRLRRNMQRYLNRQPSETSEQFWALYWHQVWQTETDSPSPLQAIAPQHLAAYVQEPCYWAAQKITQSFTSSQYSLADCFQMAIARLDKILQGFDPHQGFNFKNYASVTFSSFIRERLRQRQEVDICTDWALLRKLSQKRLTESLQSTGLSPATVDGYVLAWTGFKTLYTPSQAGTTRQLPKPSAETWQAIAQFYNRERLQTLTAEAPAATPDLMEKWLIGCAKAARAYLYPNTVSINTPKPGQSGEFLDDLPEGQQESLLSDLIAEEESQTRQKQRSQVSAVLSAALAQLDAESQALIQLYYRQEMTQQQMAAQLGIKQYTISRRLTKAREKLLLAFAQWSQENLHIVPTPDVLKHTSVALEEWLKTYYSHPEPSSSVEQSS